jgi:hypothetical protein
LQPDIDLFGHSWTTPGNPDARGKSALSDEQIKISSKPPGRFLDCNDTSRPTVTFRLSRIGFSGGSHAQFCGAIVRFASLISAS